MKNKSGPPQGGGFLVTPVLSEEIFTREDLTEDQLLYEKTADDFMRKEVVPLAEDIDAKKPGLMPSLLKKAGEVGLLMIEVPEEYGGLGLNKAAASLVIEKMALNASFNSSFGAHTGIGMLPIVYYGNAAQKEKYLPRLGRGEILSCYALTEPTAGSDALSIKTKARLSPDGKFYVLNGTKQFITNAGFADTIITYAKVDGEKFTAFILEKTFPGVSIGPEEHKMGITGSSTCQVILDDVKVPVENLLGEIGKGHYIAFNILNIGRYKLGVGTSGAAKEVLTEAVKYGLERKQFNTPIVQFPAIKDKIAEVAVSIFVNDSITSRVAGAMDQRTDSLDKKDPAYAKKAAGAIEEYALEDSVIKVFGSETLNLAVDHCLQVFGGYGYIKEYPLERQFRDSRINRIFEGTNEINRLLIPGMLMRRAMKGQLPLMEAIEKVTGNLKAAQGTPEAGDGPLAGEVRAAELAKRAHLYVLDQVIRRYGQGIDKEQQALMALSDMTILLFGMDSLLGRVTKILGRRGEAGSHVPVEIARVFCAESVEKIGAIARRLLASLFTGGELDGHLQNLAEFVRFLATDTYSAKRKIADTLIADGGWNLTIC